MWGTGAKVGTKHVHCTGCWGLELKLVVNTLYWVLGTGAKVDSKHVHCTGYGGLELKLIVNTYTVLGVGACH